ncbi:bifunctional phosphoribosylaminoimidazolecarboxamide formyltransferase/IMP cyclohydrolase [Trueperella pecoris]|uniref:Bifunctional purine biosynthesis protein PurH n=1 Tax=Trueperella pecoris TaxID=2733571 RepID=A0A7M1QSR9_9ACTO|nr:bifunctional phosphoribosylaminoimidazolecarboxamide formyltransferase/IMP cyclohydrolase [Trueperella pecoris]QOR45059.1 bifunctional phosphoribosylaminoimidazolecarboxamide formyltransferase/IMP cyclohydrolase [Trueperella pecoris]
MARALISVSNKSGIAEFARSLSQAGLELISTGSTAAAIAAAGVPVTPVEAITGFPESFDGRVKTLHPKVHGGILARRGTDDSAMEQLGIEPIDVVVVNLYPFAETVASGAQPAECIEQIDIGGPALIRAAAKNHRDVAVVTSPDQYAGVARELEQGAITEGLKRELAAAAFAHTASYDAAIAAWFAWQGADAGGTQLPDELSPRWSKTEDLRYGENPHQAAALYRDDSGRGLANATQLGGKPMSFNNYQDTEAAVRAAYDHERTAVAIVKHANPCGVAVGDDVARAHALAHACDPQSAYGGVVAANRPVTRGMAEQLKPIFTEVVAAPAFDDDALEILRTKKNLRILVVEPAGGSLDIRPISGGAVAQEADVLTERDTVASWELVAGQPADEATIADLEFAWRSVRCVKSNAILLAKGGATVGVGMGQVNRVDSCKLAVERANTLGDGERARGAVAASDAFFPFADGFEVLANAGVSAVVQPGGSIRDADVIEAAQRAGVTMYLTHTRHFAH